MDKIIVYFTFIPWLLYYFYNVINAVLVVKDKKISGQWMKKHIFQLFHFNDLILYAIFFYFLELYNNADHIWLVSILLFSAINLYLFINSFYDVNRSKNRIEVSDFSNIMIIVIITIIPFIYYMLTGSYINTYCILFAMGFGHYLVAIVTKIINNGMLKLLGLNR